ncbi:MAG: ABC transporter ATP-binding protein/permease [Bifidobacterium sp.]|nr:ABC transporter ATP-binding protein/permease [Bifidobacterium sp.]
MAANAMAAPMAASRPASAHALRRLMALNIPHWKPIVLAMVCTLLVNGALIAKPYILKVVIDDFLTRRVPQHGLFSLWGMAGAYLAVVAASGLLSVVQTNVINRVGQEIMRDLRRRVFTTIQLLPLSRLDRTPSGGLITRATNDTEALSDLYTDVLLSLFQDVFLIIGTVAAMAAMDIHLTLISFSVLPVMFLIIFLMRKAVRNTFARMKRLVGRINGFLAETLAGMRTIQMFHKQSTRRRSFVTLNTDYYDVSRLQVLINSILKPASTVFENLAIALIIWYGMGRISDQSLQIGVLYAFTSYISQFFDPISDMADNYTTIQSALVSADRIFTLLDTSDTLEDLEAGRPLTHMCGTIEFRHVWFAYHDEDWVLKDVSFAAPAGSTLAFVGRTGAGKTTVTNLISGFYRIQRGQILIDGVDINTISRRDLRRQVALVLQDVFLFSGTIKENITLNDPIDDAAAEYALAASYAKPFVDRLPAGINEPVMERGETFSAGQRQLLSFARAIAHKPRVLILDEASANIDSRTESLLQRAIANVSAHTTTLIVAHRLSTIRDADRIIVLGAGRILEQGSHDELMQRDGYYRRMIVSGEESTQGAGVFAG